MHDDSQRKAIQRRRAYDARNAECNKDAASRAAIARLVELEAYVAASTVLWYVDCRSELRTQWFLPTALGDKQIVVPFCTELEGEPVLGLWRLQAMDELVVGKWKILEPPADQWHATDRVVRPDELDVAIVPGVAFSPGGARLGNGQGYYDRLLASVAEDCKRVGLCYECQLFDDLVVGPLDIGMDVLVTEERVLRT